MSWLKNVIVDILVTIFIAAACWLGDPWMWWVIVVYSVLLIIAKGIAVRGDGILSRAQKQKSDQAPEWFLHLLYGVNVILLGLAAWWILMSGWIVIWILSYVSKRNS